MASTGYEVKTRSGIDQYNYEADQILLRALDGAGGTWERHRPKTNISDIIAGVANDNEERR